MDQFLTLETPNLGPDFNSTAYIYIYMHAVEWLCGPSLAIWGVIIWAKFVFQHCLWKDTLK